MDFDLSENFEVKVGMHQGSMLSPSPVAVMVFVFTELARKCVSSELMNGYELVLLRQLAALGISSENGWTLLRSRV